MALSVRRTSDWAVVLCTDAGQIIKFDKTNFRLRSTERPRERRVSTSHANCPLCQQRLPTGIPTRTRAASEAVPADERTTTHSSFVHPEYFTLLATCLEEEHVLDMEDDDNDDHLSTESFNQGYCARFFVEEGILGRGGKGEVVKVRHVLEGVSLGVFALKRVAVGDSQAWLVKTLREVQSLRFKHPNLVSYNHVWLERHQRSFSPTIPVLHILQEYCDAGDLETFVHRTCGKLEPSFEQMKERSRRRSRGHPTPPSTPGLSVDMVYSFFRDILAGLAFLHEQGMVHRDMKASNCLLDMHGATSDVPRVLVSDFGEAQFASSNEQRSGSTGTLSYTAPEIIRGEKWTMAADIFSLGMVLYFLTHEGSLPYNSPVDDFDGLRDEILNFTGYSLFSSQSNLSKDDQVDLDSVLSSLLAPDPAERPTCKDLLTLMHLHDRKTATSKRPPTTYQNSFGEEDDSIPKWPDTDLQPLQPMRQGSAKLLLDISQKGQQGSRLVSFKANMNAFILRLIASMAARQDEILSLALLAIRLNATQSILPTIKAQGPVIMLIFLTGLLETIFQLSYTTRLVNSILLALFSWLSS